MVAVVLWLWLESARLLPKRVLGLLAVARVSSLLSKESGLGRPVARILGSSQRSDFGDATSKRYAFSAVKEVTTDVLEKCLGWCF